MPGRTSHILVPLLINRLKVVKSKAIARKAVKPREMMDWDSAENIHRENLSAKEKSQK